MHAYTADKFDVLWASLVWLALMPPAMAAWIVSAHVLMRRQPGLGHAFAVWLAGFLVAYGVILAIGFDRTGDWIRFVAFRLGVSHVDRVAIHAPPEWQAYSWGGEGIAGLENDSYLVLDPAGRFAAPWSGPQALACPIAASRWMAPNWRLLTTFNCTLQ